MLSLVEQRVREVVGRAAFTQSADGGSERLAGGVRAVARGESSTGKVTLGGQQRGELALPPGIQQPEQFGGGTGVAQLRGGLAASGQAQSMMSALAIWISG